MYIGIFYLWLNSGHKVEGKKRKFNSEPDIMFEIAIVHAFYGGKRVLVPCCTYHAN